MDFDFQLASWSSLANTACSVRAYNIRLKRQSRKFYEKTVLEAAVGFDFFY